jgi:type IV secretion system protein VirB3
VDEDELIVDPLRVAATRPALLLGIPWPLAVGYLMAAAEFLVLFGIVRGAVLALAIVGTIWGLTFLVCRRDYHGPRVVLLWADVAIRSFDTAAWGGHSPSPLPIRAPRRFRGMRHA